MWSIAITDATPTDESGRFWAINTFYPGDEASQTSNDPLAAEYGEAPRTRASRLSSASSNSSSAKTGSYLPKLHPSSWC